MLVGPNGAGKTNIVDALNFLSLLSRGGVTEAVSRFGGAGKVMSRSAISDSAHEVYFSVEGERLVSSDRYLDPSPADLSQQSWKRGIRLAKYRYELVIRFERDRLFVKTELLKVSLLRTRRVKGDFRTIEDRTPELAPDYSLYRRVDPEGRPGVRIDRTTLGERYSTEYISRSFYNELVGTSYRGGDPHGEKTVFAHASNQGDALVRKIAADFRLGEPFNIVPDRVRATMDIASPSGVQRDGYGLAATLWGMMRGTKGQLQQGYERKSRLLTYVQRVNPSVRDIAVELDAWDSSIRVICSIGTENSQVKVSISQLSDGTLKWLALMAAIVEATPLLAIEEPENFIHPAVQKALVEILREQISTSRAQTFVFLTTHSETLINALEPTELIVVSMVDGQTNALRPVNTDLLLSEIGRTGFGLGYYYLAGALDD